MRQGPGMESERATLLSVLGARPQRRASSYSHTAHETYKKEAGQGRIKQGDKSTPPTFHHRCAVRHCREALLAATLRNYREEREPSEPPQQHRSSSREKARMRAMSGRGLRLLGPLLRAAILMHHWTAWLSVSLSAGCGPAL